MEQQEFTDYVIPSIVGKFPQFKDLCTQKPNGIIDIDYKSKRGLLTLWLTTQDKEITIGLTDITGLNDWHTHMSLFGANTPDEEISVAVTLIDDIISDGETIVYSTVLGYFLTDNVDSIFEFKQEDETIQTFHWSEL